MIAKRMTVAEARRIAGSLGFPTKMPGSSYGLPARACIAGAALANVPGTPCARCYALKDQYAWPNAQKGQTRRLEAIFDPRWEDAMVTLLGDAHARPFRKVDMGLRPGPKMERMGGRHRLNAMGFHRWHDSGDLQSVSHVARICEIVRRTPKIKHWLPTQELRLVHRFRAEGGTLPDNLAVRVSTVMLDGARPRAWPLASMVFTDKPPAGAHVCPAPKQGNSCQACRACWSTDVPMVAYAAH